MRTRKEMKAIARERFSANYWLCVLTALLVELVLGLISSPAAIGNLFFTGRQTAIFNLSLWSVVALLLAGPLAIGLNYFYVMNILGRDQLVDVGTPFRTAFTNYGRKLGGYLWMLLLTLLWALLFYIPGIVKAYAYSMTPYILADCPNVRARDALKLSMRIMKGHKWELFVLQLSFLGWELLSALTLGLLDLFYVAPYMYNTYATFYLEAREEALRSGVITMGQLEGTEAV